MIIAYQLIINGLTVVLCNALDHKKKTQICFALLFLVNFFLDRYQTNNTVIVLVLLFSRFSDIYSKSLFEIAAFLIPSTCFLVNSHGYSYLNRITGSSNFLFIENFVFSISLAGLICLTINSLAKLAK